MNSSSFWSSSRLVVPGTVCGTVPGTGLHHVKYSSYSFLVGS